MWSLITSETLSARYCEHGSIHDVSRLLAFAVNQINIPVTVETEFINN